ncbi:unnamed protein product [Parascedosporium putredinis]|uniref:Tryptophan synthase beta chain-like PALP domain-containing protein n=1 Tax=Parascedosporium putredinis TaxID=1442378 RepID=A0A9P1HAW3_9PEZI|nr:unnamed protein product [Parascedosporium putredinis]CAI8003296.1 unnamed protein product [Parascedosporium putredinis]
MSLRDHPKAYGSAVTVAFVAGILVTLGFKDLYPDLEARVRPRRDSIFFFGGGGGGPVTLQDHEAVEVDISAVVDGLEGCIGNTPLVRIKSLCDATGREIFAKAEFLNGAGGSQGPRRAQHDPGRRAKGLLVPGRGDTIYEGTVGSTGISLATLARAKGYRAHICMPDDMSREKSDLLVHLGAEVERHAAVHADGSVGFFADQFESEANYTAHVKTTGPEIFSQTGGDIDAFVAGAGTGGTISGVAKYLKEEMKLPGVKIILADPQGSGLYNKIRHGVDTMVEGIGINRITHNFEAGRELIDDAVRVTDDQASRMARWLVEKDGIFVGSSSAVNCVAAAVAAMTLPREAGCQSDPMGEQAPSPSPSLIVPLLFLEAKGVSESEHYYSPSRLGPGYHTPAGTPRSKIHRRM